MDGLATTPGFADLVVSWHWSVGSPPGAFSGTGRLLGTALKPATE